MTVRPPMSSGRPDSALPKSEADSPFRSGALELSFWCDEGTAVGARGVLVVLPAAMVSTGSGDPMADGPERPGSAGCEAGVVEAVALGVTGLSWPVIVIGWVWAGVVVGLTVLTGPSGRTGDVGAIAMFGVRFDIGGVDTDTSAIGASSVPPSTGSRRHQFGTLHHMRRSACG
ncbi:hypothetical protein [Lentzea aerocolonigenes]|uniref:hypothetical protein n=1 Tax=Lentzea aerocolonigenes TaxID=68170 RepID=UPI0012DCBD65|nr:hypothetical protein [Lentzea aerocolonigenes]